MNGLRLPLTNANVPAYVADKRAKATSAFALQDYDVVLILFIVFYILIRNSGTIGALKSVANSNVLTDEKVSIFNDFHFF